MQNLVHVAMFHLSSSDPRLVKCFASAWVRTSWTRPRESNSSGNLNDLNKRKTIALDVTLINAAWEFDRTVFIHQIRTPIGLKIEQHLNIWSQRIYCGWAGHRRLLRAVVDSARVRVKQHWRWQWQWQWQWRWTPLFPLPSEMSSNRGDSCRRSWHTFHIFDFRI